MTTAAPATTTDGKGIVRIGADGAVSAATRIAGLPLLVRLVKQLAQAGAREVLLVSDAPDGRWRLLLERHRADRGLRIEEQRSEELPADTATLDAQALYTLDALRGYLETGGVPAPKVRVEDRASAREANRWLWRSIRKSMSHDGPVAFFLARPVSNQISRALLPTGIAPNVVTVVGLVVGLASGVVASLGGYGPALAATLLFYLGMIFDCVDGDLARLTLTTSRSGQWLDSLVDDLSVVALTIGMGVGLWRETGHEYFLLGGLIAAGLVVVGQAVIYVQLARSGGPIDTAKYPWFFVGAGGLAYEGRRSLVGWLSFLPRRDCQTLAYVIFAALGWRPLILLALAAGGAVYFVLLCVDRLAKGLGWVEGSS